MEPAIRRVRANGQSRQCSLFSQAESLAPSGSIRARNAQSQIPIAQPRPGLPSFRQQGDYNACSEGWRFTQRAWAKVTGFYQDPYSDYGRLSSELLRAVAPRALNTAVHYKRWTRQQMIDFLPNILRKMSQKYRKRRTATSSYPRKHCDTSLASSICGGYVARLRPNWAALTMSARFTMEF